MDVCCLDRPFDDLSQDRVYLEAEAVLSIVSHCEKGEQTLLASGVIDFELSKSNDDSKLEKVQALYEVARERILLSEEDELRAGYFQRNGLKPYDSLHLAMAEGCGADVFLTTDDRLLQAAKRSNVNIKIENPVSWLMEVMRDEQ